MRLLLLLRRQDCTLEPDELFDDQVLDSSLPEQLCSCLVDPEYDVQQVGDRLLASLLLLLITTHNVALHNLSNQVFDHCITNTHYS